MSLTLTAEQHEVLKRVAELQGRSIGSLLRELIDGVLPGLERVADLGEAYLRASEASKRLMVEAMAEADEALTPELIAFTTASEELMQRVREMEGASS